MSRSAVDDILDDDSSGDDTYFADPHAHLEMMVMDDNDDNDDDDDVDMSALGLASTPLPDPSGGNALDASEQLMVNQIMVDVDEGDGDLAALGGVDALMGDDDVRSVPRACCVMC